MFHRRLRKIGSLLGLLAILMTTLAPAVSHALVSHDRLGRALDTFCTAGPGSPSPHSAPLHGQACDYCSLLAHSPLLSGSSASLPQAPLNFSRVSVFARDDIHAPSVSLAAQPRAPPAFS